MNVVRRYFRLKIVIVLTSKDIISSKNCRQMSLSDAIALKYSTVVVIASKNSRYVSMLDVILSKYGSRLSSMDVISSKDKHRLRLVRRHLSKIVDSCRHFV